MLQYSYILSTTSNYVTLSWPIYALQLKLQSESKMGYLSNLLKKVPETPWIVLESTNVKQSDSE